MKNVICIGDSHTWGQGADDFLQSFIPPVQQGEHRQTSFVPPHYVNLLRKYINRKSESYCGEITKEKSKRIKIIGSECNTQFISVNDGKIVAVIEGSMFRLQMKCGRQGTKADILIDHKLIGQICTYDEVDNSNNYRIWEFHGLLEREHEVIIQNSGSGRLDLYRIDYYGGPYAVINSGIGSCDSEKFLRIYWEDYVERYLPYICIIEGFSINDWIKNTPIKSYIRNLHIMFDKIRAHEGVCILLTVSPILGEQRCFPDGPEYVEYIAASISAANEACVPVADAFKAITVSIPEYATEKDVGSILFEDVWHVNSTGHKIYFECIRKILEHNLNL